jgi:two-component SAPR family response regulator
VITNIDNDKSVARLLVVDDDLDIVQILKLGLQKNGFLVDEFTNPEEALRLQIKCKGLLLTAVKCQNVLFAWNTTSKKSQTLIPASRLSS